MWFRGWFRRRMTSTSTSPLSMWFRGWFRRRTTSTSTSPLSWFWGWFRRRTTSTSTAPLSWFWGWFRRRMTSTSPLSWFWGGMTSTYLCHFWIFRNICFTPRANINTLGRCGNPVRSFNHQKGLQTPFPFKLYQAHLFFLWWGSPVSMLAAAGFRGTFFGCIVGQRKQEGIGQWLGLFNLKFDLLVRIFFFFFF